MTKINVHFNDGTSKLFDGNNIVNTEVLQKIAEFCEENNLVTDGFEYVEESETVYTDLTHTPIPEPCELECEKTVISIHATVHEEQGEWLDWWIDADNAEICLPCDEKECEKYLRKFQIILVGNKWFPGTDADKAIRECFRQYKKITILDDKDTVVAEIYDRQVMYNCNDDLGGKYRWMSQSYGNVEHTFADVLECAEDGETYKHSYKGW